MKYSTLRPRRRRRGTIAVLAALFMVLMIGMVAFAVDIGYLEMVRTQLQAAADSAALAAAGSSNLTQSQMIAVAQQFAGSNTVAGRAAQLSSSDVQFGTWDASSLTFTPVSGSQLSTAVKVTVRTNSSNGGATSLFFGRLFGMSSVNQQASAVAAVNPRDIAFVIDLSGSMNDDTSPNSSTSSSSLMQTVYNQFGFGTYPGSTATLKNTTLNTQTLKQLQSVMPNVIPVPSTSNSSYWNSYFSYAQQNWNSALGYQSYLDFMMHYGRDVKPDGTNYTPLSLNSNLCTCPLHSETVGGTTFQFPPDEMPTHAARSALIAAIQTIQSQNQNISDSTQMDQVSIVGFDTSATVKQTLTTNYSAAMKVCTTLQACSDTALCTSTEAGLLAAYNLIKPVSQGGQGREHADKVIVLLTDGQPNLQVSTTTTVNNYKNAHPSTYTNPTAGTSTNNWFTSSTGGTYYNDMNAALMEVSKLQLGDSTMGGSGNWYIYAVGVGLNCDYDFMDSMARMGNTANNNGLAPRGSGDPTVYQTLMTQLFNNIVTNPKLRLVQ